MLFQKPRLVIAALRGGAGKTLVTLGLIAAWKRHRAMRVVPFKKGPDYIDAGWLSMAAQQPCYNLDPFLMTSEDMWRSFTERSLRGDVGVVEGNRGLYDGVDVQGSCSTAELAKLLGAPVVLVLDATKTTRTAAALVLGCQHLDPGVKIAGVILNQVAGKRHERVLRGAIERYCGVAVLGVVPKEKGNFFPERHLGLIPPQEHNRIDEAMGFAAQMALDCLDLDALWEVAQQAEPLGLAGSVRPVHDRTAGCKPVIGILRDAAFQFYYPDNLDALETAGANLVFISPLMDSNLPEIDALYIGGGFPETHAEELSKNVEFRNEIKSAADKGLPIYAECGGLMYLGETLVLDQSYPMAGVLPVVFGFSKKPQGHGYTVAEVVQDNPYYKKGAVIKGHEFHYSKVLEWKGNDLDMAFVMRKGRGIHQQRDGICYKNVFATYTHIHALGVKEWATTLVKMARAFAGAK